MIAEERKHKPKKANASTRFGTGKNIATFLLPTLPNSTYSAAILYCWLMGQQKEDGVTEFNESNQQIADACRVKPRQIIRVMRDLESQGIVKTIWEGRGRMPSKRIIVPKTYNSTSRLGVSLRARSSVIEGA